MALVKSILFLLSLYSGADPGFFLGGGAPVSCSTSTPINHIVFFFLQNTSCIREPQVISGGVRTPCTLPLDPPLLLTFFCRLYRRQLFYDLYCFPPRIAPLIVASNIVLNYLIMGHLTVVSFKSLRSI